ncbi:MAG: hypothetical protein LM564_03035 [Desulfurococcaceae archaeon]|nr:hypothetical protein [Desulfurococcaceae archaeon]
MSARNILFAVFDLNDTNYMKMPWALFIKTLPIIAEKMPNARIYVLTDTKDCVVVKKLIERENLKLIPISKPILRYPYRGLLGTLKTFCEKLGIDTLVVLSGWNLHVWNSVADKLRINNFVLIVLTPVYRTNELLKIGLDYLTSFLKYGEPKDVVYLIKLIFENLMVRLLLRVVKPLDKLTVVVASESCKKLFQRCGFRLFKISLKLKFDVVRGHVSLDQYGGTPSIAYFGPPIIARGYDMVVELAKVSRNISFVLYLREPLSVIAKKRIARKGIRNLKIVFKFFRSTEELVTEARKHHLLLLPFRFVVSDFPLVLMEVLCSGRLVVTTQYSHTDVVKVPNLITLDLAQVRNPDIVRRLVERGIKIPVKSCYIDWEFVADELIKFLAYGT